MEDQRPHLNALSRRLINSRRVDKCSMWDSSRPAIKLGVEALDEYHFRGCLSIKVIPLVRLIGANSQSLSPSIRVDEVHRY